MPLPNLISRNFGFWMKLDKSPSAMGFFEGIDQTFLSRATFRKRQNISSSLQRWTRRLERDHRCTFERSPQIAELEAETVATDHNRAICLSNRSREKRPFYAFGEFW